MADNKEQVIDDKSLNNNGVREEELDLQTEKSKQKKDKFTTKINILDDTEDINFFSGREKKEAPNEDLDEDLELEEEEEEEDGDGNPKGADEGEGDLMDDEDYKMMSDFAIELLDSGMGMLCSAIAKGGDPDKFKILDEKKEKLKNQFTRILTKHKFKVTIEFLFILSLGMSYRVPVQNAFKARSVNKKKKEDKENEDNTEEVDFTIVNPNGAEEEIKVPLGSRGKKRATN